MFHPYDLDSRGLDFLLERVQTDPDVLGAEDLDVVDANLPKGPSTVSSVSCSQFVKSVSSALNFEHESLHLAAVLKCGPALGEGSIV
jgi:hypothetical protein